MYLLSFLHSHGACSTGRTSAWKSSRAATSLASVWSSRKTALSYRVRAGPRTASTPSRSTGTERECKPQGRGPQCSRALHKPGVAGCRVGQTPAGGAAWPLPWRPIPSLSYLLYPSRARKWLPAWLSKAVLRRLGPAEAPLRGSRPREVLCKLMVLCD